MVHFDLFPCSTAWFISLPKNFMFFHEKDDLSRSNIMLSKTTLILSLTKMILTWQRNKVFVKELPHLGKTGLLVLNLTILQSWVRGILKIFILALINDKFTIFILKLLEGFDLYKGSTCINYRV